MALVQIEVLSKTVVLVVGVHVLKPPIQELVKVVKVVLAPAAGTFCSSSRIGIGHSLEPAIIVSTGKKEIAVISSKLFRKVLAARQNIELGIITIPIRRIMALVWSQLHKPHLARPTSSRRIARRLLQSKRRYEYRRNAKRLSTFLKDREKRLAGFERAIGFLDSLAQVCHVRSYLVHGHVRGCPSAAFDTTVEVVDATHLARGSRSPISRANRTTGIHVDSIVLQAQYLRVPMFARDAVGLFRGRNAAGMPRVPTGE